MNPLSSAKTKGFEPAMRVNFEDNAKGFNPAILQRIRGLEVKAQRIREEGKNPRIELAEDIEQLEADISFTTQVRAQQLSDEINEIQQDYRKKIEKNPNLQLLKLQEAQLKINSMDDKELKKWAYNVGNETESVTAEEASVALSRLKDSERHLVKDRVQQDYIDKPWLQDPEVKEVYQEAQMLNNTPPGHVLVDGTAIHVEHLVDFDDELNKVVEP